MIVITAEAMDLTGTLLNDDGSLETEVEDTTPKVGAPLPAGHRVTYPERDTVFPPLQPRVHDFYVKGRPGGTYTISREDLEKQIGAHALVEDVHVVSAHNPAGDSPVNIRLVHPQTGAPLCKEVHTPNGPATIVVPPYHGGSPVSHDANNTCCDTKGILLDEHKPPQTSREMKLKYPSIHTHEDWLKDAELICHPITGEKLSYRIPVHNKSENTSYDAAHVLERSKESLVSAHSAEKDETGKVIQDYYKVPVSVIDDIQQRFQSDVSSSLSDGISVQFSAPSGNNGKEAGAHIRVVAC